MNDAYSKDLEPIIALDATAQKEINRKVERKLADMKKNSVQEEHPHVTKISDVEQGKLFTTKTVWSATNLKNLAVFELKGNDVDFYLSGKISIRKMLENAEIDAFSTGNLYIKFLWASK